MSKLKSISASLFALSLACSSAPAPQPETAPPPPASTAAAPPPEPEPEPEPAAETPPPAPEPAAEPPPPAEPKLSSAPKAMITATEVAFLINYTGSDASDVAEQTCSKSAGEDAAKLAACKTKARDEFLADVIHFKRAGGNKWTWLVYKRKGSNLTEVYSAPIEFGEETDRTVAVQLKGGEGTRPLFKGSNKFVVTVPNDYSIELQDPKYGKLVYDAKVGLVGH